MNKKQLVDAIARDSGLTNADARKAVNSFIITVEQTLEKGDEVALTSFGKFSAAERGATTGPRAAKRGVRTKGAGSRQTKTASAPVVVSPFNDEVARAHSVGRLSDRLIAQAVGAAPSTVRDWLAYRSAPTGVRAEKAVALAEIVDRLTRVMDADYIPVWMTKPIAALDDHRPLDLIADGQARRVAQLVSSLEDPVAA